MKTAAIVILVLFAIMFVAIQYFRNTQPSKLSAYLASGDYEAFDHCSNKMPARLFINPFNMLCLQLNSYILRQDRKSVTDLLCRVNIARLKDNQKNYILLRAFNYYVSIEDKENAEIYQRKINQFGSRAMKQSAKWTMDAVVEGGHQYLQEVIDETEKLPDHQKIENEMLISLMYQNMGNTKMAVQYRDSASLRMEKLGHENR
ncbi:MAG: hypothetical protein EOM64_05125 [Erysipelotrichia bacterium]|nr:hypothetical protein [Erysipelotrichia bacterium]